MSERFDAESIGLAYHRFRGEHSPMPIAAQMEQLGEIIDLRVKRGLDAMYRYFAARRDVEYAGYLLAILPSWQYLHARNSEGEILRSVRVGAQDFFIEVGDCFDVRALARQDSKSGREGVYTQADFKQSGFILGPVVRMKTSDTRPRDLYNQREDLVFSTQHAVLIPGTTLLEGLYKVAPKLREGFAISGGLPHEYLTAVFDLQPKNTSFQDARRAEFLD